MKRILFYLFACIISINIHAITTGTVGNSITWQFNESTGHLKIQGSGDLKKDIWFTYGETDYYMFTDFKNFAEQIKTVEISEGITRIVQYTFQDCINLVSVSLPNTLKELDDVAFMNCKALKSITIPESLKKVNVGYGRLGDPFSGCESLESVTWNAIEFEGTCSMFSDAFILGSNAQKGALLKEIKFGSKVKVIPPRLCYGKTSITTVDIPASVKTIGDWAFQDCSSLKNIVFHEGLEEIGSSAFQNAGASYLALPSTVKIIGYSALDTRDVQEITIPENVESYGRSNATTLKRINWNAINCTSQYPFYNSANTIEAVSIGNKVKVLPDQLFYLLTNVENVVIPANVESIGSMCFASSSGLKNLVFEEGNLKKIGSMAFWMCKNIESLIIPKVDIIEENAFIACESLRTLELKSTKTIGKACFSSVPLVQVTLPENLESIEDYAFAHCNDEAEFICYAEVPPTLGIDVFYNSYDYGILYVPDNSLDAYKNNRKWSKFKTIKPISSITGIKDIKGNIKDMNCYTLDGRKNEFSNVRSNSIYIVGGKKYIKRP